VDGQDAVFEPVGDRVPQECLEVRARDLDLKLTERRRPELLC
jgi:hypothetical protein